MDYPKRCIKHNDAVLFWVAAAGSQQRSLLTRLVTLRAMASLPREDQTMLAARPILVVEDDDALRLVLADQLASDGLFHPTQAATLAEASHHLAAPEARFDAIILDITLPDGRGHDFCTRIRKQGHMMPIIMLTGAAAEDDIVSGLNP